MDLEQTLDSYEAAFHLLVIQFKMRFKELKVDDIDMEAMKNMIIHAHKLKNSPKLFLCLVFEKLNSVFMGVKYVDIARISWMLFIDHFDKYHGPKKFEHSVAYTELHFLSRFFMISCTRPKTNEKSHAQQMLFSDILTILNVKDIYPTLPDIVTDLKQAKMLFDLMTAKLNKFDELQQEFTRLNISGPTPTSYLYSKFWHGLIYHDLACFQNAHENKIELFKKALKIWNQFLADSFSKETLLMYAHTHPYGNETGIFMNISSRNFKMYSNIIADKVKNILCLKADDPAVNSLIRELNLLRKDFILQMKLALELAAIKPDCFQMGDVKEIHKSMAFHYRSIILTNKKNQKHNLDNSIRHIELYMDQMPYMLKQILINAEIALMDSNPFIKKFRKD